MNELSLVARIGQGLRGFEIVLGVEVSEQLGISTVWYPARPANSSKQKAVIAQFTRSGIGAFGPHTAIQAILEMTGAGIIDRIRRCGNPGCLKWIMVTNSKRITCSDACRFAKYQVQEGSRANDMRKSRELHKNHPHVKRQRTARPTKAAKKGGE
jgi:hypothetical protein